MALDVDVDLDEDAGRRPRPKVHGLNDGVVAQDDGRPDPRSSGSQASAGVVRPARSLPLDAMQRIATERGAGVGTRRRRNLGGCWGADYAVGNAAAFALERGTPVVRGGETGVRGPAGGVPPQPVRPGLGSPSLHPCPRGRSRVRPRRRAAPCARRSGPRCANRSRSCPSS